MTREEFTKKAAKMPDGPGVYFFLGPHKRILYIGKAASLRDRVRSYFSPDLRETRSELIVRMVEEARSVDWRETDSVLEALILEANLIRSHKPKANTDLKDDKSFNYVVVTAEVFPRILLVRGKNLEHLEYAVGHTFGPFPHGMQLKVALKIVRKIFPFRDSCELGAGKPCFNRQLGLCPGVCSGEILKADYKRTVRHIVLFFQGKKKALLRELVREMKHAAGEENFERAGEIRRQLFALKHIQDVSLIKDEYRSPAFQGESGVFRIEAYDVAHLGGTATVGVMVVMENGSLEKEAYRTFHIRFAKGGDDVGAIREVFSRRLAHIEWPYPRLIVVDGAQAQIHAAQKLLDEAGVRIPIVGVVKDERHRPRGMNGDHHMIREYEQDIVRANAEAHRFAIARHKVLRTRRLLEK